jgi:hypothetical protein
MGAVFSVVTGNHIHDIWVKRQFSGAEIGGIKFHGAIDTLISDNHIHRAGRGLWLDWMAQGTHVTGNLFYDNTTDDLFLEVNHGPFLIDNNILLSPTAVRTMSEGGAYAHNLVSGNVVLRPELRRSTPFHKPHSTEVAGLSRTEGGDDRWYNNLFLGHSGLSAYDGAKLPVWMGGNVFLGGARPSTDEKDAAVIPESSPEPKVVEKADGFYLRFKLGVAWREKASTGMVTSELLGRAKRPDQGYTRADGTPVKIDADYLGKERVASKPAPGPFAGLGHGELELKVWPKARR